jgi:hypothetical protein
MLGIDAVIARLPITVARQNVIGLVPSCSKIAGGASYFQRINAEKRNYRESDQNTPHGWAKSGKEIRFHETILDRMAGLEPRFSYVQCESPLAPRGNSYP